MSRRDASALLALAAIAGGACAHVSPGRAIARDTPASAATPWTPTDEARAEQKHELVAQHLPGRAKLAAKAIPLAQQPSLAVGPAVLEVRKRQRDQFKAIDIRHKPGHVAVVGPKHTGSAGALHQFACVGGEPLSRNQHRGIVGDRGVIQHADIRVVSDLQVLNERHRRAP